jgi:hypothetical protein
MPWVFMTSSRAVLFIAMVTVSSHSILVARANAVAALRYERGAAGKRAHSAPAHPHHARPRKPVVPADATAAKE